MAESNALPQLITPGYADHAKLHNDVNARAPKYGTGTPEGVISAVPGVTYVDTNATLGVTMWVKASGTGNTGWKVLQADTGGRNIGSILANSWTAASAFLRRFNNTVELRLVNLSAGNNTICLALPAGFQPGTGANIRTPYFEASALATTPAVISANVTLPEIANGTLCVTFTTTQDWPSSLPGIAAT